MARPFSTLPSTPAEGTEVQLTMPWGHVSGLRYGPADGVKVLAIHGWLDNANSFHDLASKFLPPNVSLVSVDLPGHGFSSHKPSGQYIFLDWVQDVEYIAQALGWREFALVGHSMGAAISLLYSGVFPEKITGLMLLDGIVPIQDSEDKACEILRQSILKHAVITKKQRIEPSMEAAEAKLLNSNAALTPESARLLLKRGAIACDGGYMFTRDVRVRLPPPFRMTEAMVNSFLVRVSCDVMLVVAENGYHDLISERERRQVELLQKTAKSFELIRVVGTHHVHMNEPATVAPHFLRFIQQQTAQSAKL